jgi:ATP synthase F1 gamma subunit
MAQKAVAKNNMRFYKEMGEIVETLKGVAATEYLRLQQNRKYFDEFEEHLKDFFKMIKLDGFQHPFLDSSSDSKIFILITSDTGFLGRLNIAVVNLALEQCGSKDKIIIVGKQGQRYVSVEDVPGGVDIFPGVSDKISYIEAVKLRNHLINSFLEGKKGSCIIIYPHFVSSSVQEVKQLRLFPCRFLFGEEKEAQTDYKLEEFEEVILEPSLKEVVEGLVETWVGQLLFEVFWESKLSEWSARVMHLEQSSNEINRASKEVRHQYFRTLHELSDKGIREIFASKVALAQGKQNEYERKQ